MKVLYTVLGILMVLGLMAGCAPPAATPTATPAPTTTPKPVATPTPTASPGATAPQLSGKLPESFIFMTTSGGKVYSLTASYSQLFNRYGPMKSEVQIVAGVPPKVKLMQAGSTHSFVLGGAAPYSSYIGAEKGTPAAKLRILIGGGYPAATVFSYYVRPDSGIKTVKDLKGKRILFYSAVDYYSLATDAIFKVNGMTRDDVKWLNFTNPPDAYKEVKEKRVDAIMYAMGTETTDMAQSTGLYIVPLTPQEQAAVHAAVPTLEGVTVAKGDDGANADTPVLASLMYWYTVPDLNDLTAYTAVKTLFDHLDEFHASYPVAKGFNKNTAAANWLIPYHPGAIAYYKQMGLWGDAQEKNQQKLLEAEKNIFK